MIEKMEFLRLTGPKGDFDRVVEKYLTKYEIHLENALVDLGGVQDLKPFVEANPYKAVVSHAQTVLTRIRKDAEPSARQMDVNEAKSVIEDAFVITQEYRSKVEGLHEERKRHKKSLSEIEPFRGLDCDLKRIRDFQFMQFHFGRIAHQYYNKFSKYVYENLETVFVECDKDNLYVWGAYFIPNSHAMKVDAVYSSLHFERVSLADDYEGKPEDVYQSIQKKVDEIDGRIKEYKEKMKEALNRKASDILLAYQELDRLNQYFEVRKWAACTREKRGQVFYLLCGWMAQSDAKKFLKEIEDDELLYCIDEEDANEGEMAVQPPTKLRNPKVLKPFEMFVKMYGLPAYNEMDPTLFLALTYTLMFGIMFGDVGQGLCLVVGGALLYRSKKMDVAAIVSLAGLWSVVFGFLYGSVFGFEDWFAAVWMHPMHDIMKTLTISVVFGMGLILIAMVIHVRNAVRQKDRESLWLDPSGIPGLVCYGMVVVFALLVLMGKAAPPRFLLLLLIGVPLLVVFLKEPLGNLLEKKKRIFPEGSKGMFFIEAFVELFDVVLSYTTNTLSFLRVGAFALIHVGMMGVVFSLAEGPGGKLNFIVIIVGNILVAALEALVVGIQVLRLEYYEMFSRFYKGSGKEFKSIQDVTAVNK